MMQTELQHNQFTKRTCATAVLFSQWMQNVQSWGELTLTMLAPTQCRDRQIIRANLPRLDDTVDVEALPSTPSE